MSALQRWLAHHRSLFIGLCVCLLLVIGTIFLRKQFTATPEEKLLSGKTRSTLQETLPQHSWVKYYAGLSSFPGIQQDSATTLAYTIHPSLFDAKRATGDHLISGTTHITNNMQYNHSTQDAVGTIQLSGSILATENKENISRITYQATLNLRLTPEHVYLNILKSDFSQTGKKIQLIHETYLFINHYTDTWIRFNRNAHDRMGLLTPYHIYDLIETQSKKIRVLPTQDENGRLYSLSGDALSISGTWYDTVQHMQDLHIPTYDITLTRENTHIPHMYVLKGKQDNDYQGAFEGTHQIEFKPRNISQHIIGEATWPGGVWLDIQHHNTYKKSAQDISLKLPSQYLDRDNLGFKVRK